MQLSFQIVDTPAPRALTIDIHSLVIAGWVGRDAAATEHHIEELAALGVKRPSSYPLYYRVAAGLLTQASQIQVLGTDSSGEAEVFAFCAQGEMFVSLVSDHTDRKLEAQGVAVSKQVCAKPVARSAWRYADVAAHWDELILRSSIEESGTPVVYQEGRLAALRPPAELIAGYGRSTGTAGNRLAEGCAMSCGTLSAIGGVRPARSFAMELFDPRRKCSLVHRYAVEVLPVIS
jgi:Protein of unknown function (DUF2848)